MKKFYILNKGDDKEMTIVDINVPQHNGSEESIEFQKKDIYGVCKELFKKNKRNDNSSKIGEMVKNGKRYIVL
ncbi:STP1 protein [Plasmodium malariae]|uniref:STP1 protein n=1 Tax=Plasmodium malariae TaxID=5858 RepID=A0A1A8X0A2_PLAMA|nr:STP1 protein [Plasmodium malariae]